MSGNGRLTLPGQPKLPTVVINGLSNWEYFVGQALAGGCTADEAMTRAADVMEKAAAFVNARNKAATQAAQAQAETRRLLE